MNWNLIGLGRTCVKMEEAGGAGGEGGAGGGTGGKGGAGGGALGGGAGGAGDAGGAGGAGDQGGQGGEGGEGGDKGALGGAGAGDTIDWEKITDAEYFGRVKLPEIEGVTINAELASKRYGEFCRKHHISPEVAAEFMKLEGEGYAASMKKIDEASAKSAAEVKANFDAQGEALHKAYNAEQIQTAVNTLRNSAELNGDADFMKMVTGPMSNNKTMVALLLNWAQTHKTDANTGAGNGAGGGGDYGFAARWTGKKI